MKTIFEVFVTTVVGLILFVAAIEMTVWCLDQGEWTRFVGMGLFIGVVSYMMGAAVILSIKAGWKSGWRSEDGHS